MNKPQKINNYIFKDKTEASDTIHNLLIHVKNKGIDWTPKSFGINESGQHVLSFIEGEVPNNCPSWIWNQDILIEAAKKLREWHDATVDFQYHSEKWLLENDETREVICHCDFAPYNSVFKNHKLVGIIDFDVCSPGSRIWDISYTAYRFVPLLPSNDMKYETSPFNYIEMKERLVTFLKAYSQGQKEYYYEIYNVILKAKKRLLSLSKWSENFGNETKNKEIINDSRMYKFHATWITSLLN